MRPLSRHLPLPEATNTRIPVIGKIILTTFLTAIGYWIFVAPYNASLVLGTIIGIISVTCFIDRRRIARLRKERDDTICDFRKSFDLHEIDPWIIRATYETIGAWVDQKKPFIPLRASDLIERDLRMHLEDMWELICEVSQRAGYDVSDCEANPLFGKILSVEDFVLFINHQPRIQEQNKSCGATGRA